jgi:hypothetical protein
MATSMAALAAQVSMLEVHQRVARPDYQHWRNHVSAAASCAHPIRLYGQLWTVEPTTGRVVAEARTADMPDGVLYVPCGNRRVTVCPHCSEVYRADTYQLVKAGLSGGKGVPETVAAHPCVFFTGTAPSFGPVHTHHRDGRPCHPRRNADTCPHGITFDCRDRHIEDDPIVGTPLCLDCYDHEHQVVWNGYAGELWRRTTITANRLLRRLGKRHGVKLRLSYAKVAEFQRRGVVHIHAMIRIDVVDPDDPERVLAPPPGITSGHLAQIMTEAAERTAFTTEQHPNRAEGWDIGWGAQLDPRQVRLTVRDIDDTGEITTTAVAGYLAKYATKATELAGHVSARITPATIRRYARTDTHPGRLIGATWHLGTAPRRLSLDEADDWDAGYGRLRRWAHMLGFGGHFSTKSRRYSTTLGALRAARRAWRRAHLDQHGPADGQHHDEAGEETTVVIGSLSFAGIGWHTTADALLANTAAAMARESRTTAREEITTCYPS